MNWAQLTNDLNFIMPEIILAVGTMAMMMVGAFAPKGGFKIVCVLTVLIWAAAGLYNQFWIPEGTPSTWGGMLVWDELGVFFKSLMTVGAIAALLLAMKDLEHSIMARFEYPVLMGFALLGLYLMVSASDLIMLYMGLELSSLALYVLAAFNRNSPISSEAGLKYFVLGAIASGFILFGSSLVYGYSGSTNFRLIGDVALSVSDGGPAVLAFGLALVLAGLAFKIAAVPFHVWSPDVYDGAPSSVTAFFAIVPQIATIGLLIHLLTYAFGGMQADWRMIITFMAVASLAVGSFGALVQTNLKRLLAYSSIGNVGFLLLGFVVNTPESFGAMFLYMMIYMVTTIGIFGIILQLRKGGQAIEKIADLSGLGKNHPLMAYAMTVFMFSIAGIPPLAGFFAKFAIVSPVVSLGAFEPMYYALATFAVVMSVVSAWYYINIIRVMFFETNEDTNVTLAHAPVSALIVGLCIAFTVLFILVPGDIWSLTDGLLIGIPFAR